jgi:O6-methylguanine-DNA--protein-cysteine methyltransferase
VAFGLVPFWVSNLGEGGIQREVWHALRKIPCGTTISYAKLAEQIGRPAAVAVGLANGSNPVGVVVRASDEAKAASVILTL